ncbi:EF hand [Roseovarius gaetbuli]|uniref:EF hand n=1 Tax=Roseovarius gaetbuli TaxID=1356575 RepID=A0A1X6Y3S5_9RHOB|nr:EF-hand domain-containing protein [Roseovarius gaetbuli]SLN09756.1 EF hand [Roseovarius gaetbuli]
MMKFIVLVLGLGALANAAIAMGEAMAELDANGDGMLSVSEVQAAYPDISAETFSEVDTNSDGALDEAELIAGQEQGLLPDMSVN